MRLALAKTPASVWDEANGHSEEGSPARQGWLMLLPRGVEPESQIRGAAQRFSGLACKEREAARRNGEREKRVKCCTNGSVFSLC